MRDLLIHDHLRIGKAAEAAQIARRHGAFGGKDEAWYYRADFPEVWQSGGGLAWLKKAALRK